MLTEEENKKHKVFVYGTLRPEDEKGNYLPATHRLYFYDMYNYYDEFPYIVTGEGMVIGNIKEVDDLELEQLDKYEGVDRGLYRREVGVVYSTSDIHETPQKVWMYVGDSIVTPLVASGDWADV